MCGDYMDLIKITELTNQLDISSRSLRYYEQIGLIKSVRPECEKYRFYDDENVERLKQIIVLRKMQIPVRDILRIYESTDMSVVVETFVNRIHAIDIEIGALAELKRITGEFLQTMMQNGVTKISALPLLYEEIGKQLELMEERKPVTAADLNAVSEQLAKPLEISITSLPSMRVISSYLKSNPQLSDIDGFSRFIQSSGIVPGNHERFEFQNGISDVVILRVPDDYANESEFLDYVFPGSMFATANIYLDEDLCERFRTLVKDFDDNKYYQIDYTSDGNLRHEVMLENLISPDDQRELVSLFVPVKKRLADPALFDKPQEITDISIAEIEAANPVLWMIDVPFNTLRPINNPHYRILDNGELEYTGWISTRVLSTEVKVKLPFRVDIEFRVGDGKLYGYGATEESIIFYHGEHGLNHNYGFGINMENTSDANLSAEAIRFHQPIFKDKFKFPKRGRINNGVYNKLTWIIGEKHLAIIINGEVRYCGVHFPYMALDLSREEFLPIVIGSNGQGMKYFRSIRVSQLAERQKNRIKKGELTMITKQSNNIIPLIHRLVTDEYGENYWFNGCAKYVMECLNEKDYDYWFFAGLTGDVFTQHYTYTKYSGDALTSYMMDENMGGNPVRFVEKTFAKSGYTATFVHNRDLQKNTEMYLNTLIAYIDKGIPVIAWGQHLVGVFVGYEDYGKVLLYITGNKNEPERIPLEKLLQSGADNQIVWEKYDGGWIFVGEKKEDRALAEIYRDAICEIPKHMSIKTDLYCFGAEAFRAMANDIENGKFDGMKPEEFDAWAHYTNFICVLATNGSCCHEFLKRARELNPDMDFLEEISRLYKRTADIWNNDNGKDLETLGGGFNVTLEVLQNTDKRNKIAAKIREAADCVDSIVKIIETNLETQKN